MGCGKLQWVVASCSALCYSYSAFCNSFDAIMFTALLFSILVFVWTAHCRSGQFWAGLGGSEQVFAAHVMSRICFLYKNLVHMCLPINCLHHKCLPHTYFLHKCLTCVVVGLVAVLQYCFPHKN